MGSLGWQETIVIFVLALLLFGPKKLPELGKNLAKAIGEFRRASSELKDTWQREMTAIEKETEEIKKETQSAVDSTYDYPDSSYDYNYDSSYDYGAYGETQTADSASADAASAAVVAEAGTGPVGGEDAPAIETAENAVPASGEAPAETTADAAEPPARTQAS
jgi:sec-independent protein translocase protein TatA